MPSGVVDIAITLSTSAVDMWRGNVIIDSLR